MNLEQLRKRTRAASGFNMVSLYGDDDIDLIVNEVYADICGAEDWPFLYVDELTDLDDSTVELTWPVRTLSSLVFGDGGRIRATTVDEIDMLDPERTGKPEVYARLDDKRVMLWPTPDKTYTGRVRGFRKPQELTQDADAPEFESEFHSAIVYESAARLLVEFGDFDRVEGLREQASDALSRMRVRYLASKDRGIIQMGGRIHDRHRWRV